MPIAYILSVNIHRRHMTKGQRAMAVAKILETNNLTQGAAAKESGVSQTRIAQSRTVLEFAPDLADNVLAGAASLDDAYKIAMSQRLKLRFWGESIRCDAIPQNRAR